MKFRNSLTTARTLFNFKVTVKIKGRCHFFVSGPKFTNCFHRMWKEIAVHNAVFACRLHQIHLKCSQGRSDGGLLVHVYITIKSGQVNFYGVTMTSEWLLNLFYTSVKFYTVPQKQISGYAPAGSSPSPFITTQLESWYLFYHLMDGRRLSRPGWLASYRATWQQAVIHPKCSLIQVLSVMLLLFECNTWMNKWNAFTTCCSHRLDQQHYNIRPKCVKQYGEMGLAF